MSVSRLAGVLRSLPSCSSSGISSHLHFHPLCYRFSTKSSSAAGSLLYSNNSLDASTRSWPHRHNALSTAPFHIQTAAVHMSSSNAEERRSKWPFHMTMSDEQKKVKEQRIKEMKEEEPPKSMFAKIKYYFKRYWYIAVPAHMISSSFWFGSMFALVYAGIDVVSMLQMLHIPEAVIEKIQNTPPSAGAFVIALLLYKIATPLRYATTLVLIQAGFWTLRRFGKLQTAREVEYTVRSEYEKNKVYYGRRLYRYRNMGVRDVVKKNLRDMNARQRTNGNNSNKADEGGSGPKNPPKKE